MKKRYTTSVLLNKNFTKLLIITIMFTSAVVKTYGQVIIPFAPRTSINPPSSTIYNIKGDFTMMGNTNLTLIDYDDNIDNDNDMEYVDIDTDSNTFNSSSANLTFSTENAAIPDCSKIIYAGLYWTGRAGSDETFTVTKSDITKTFDKTKVLLKGPGETVYEPLTANNNAIIYPSGEYGNMYVGYTEVTEYVKTHGVGEYTVADIALLEGNGGNIGYYGGWGMVVVYENSKMKWRDITVFDGYAYVASGEGDKYISVNGFNAVQNGPVSLKLGVMAGEGDKDIPGDTFDIIRQDNGLYEPLSHSGNSTTNFFNASIQTGPNTRNPNLINNTGLDIVMFDIDNDNNKYIDNGDTSTTFRYSSTQDTYIIFNATFSVDAYIPEPVGILTNASGGSSILQPGESDIFKLEIKNQGTEAINNTLITIPLPEYLNSYSASSLNINTFLDPSVTTATAPVVNPPNGLYPFGYITWYLGTLPLPSNPNTLLAEINFTQTITTNCQILNSDPTLKDIKLSGFFSGDGAISTQNFTNIPFITGYQSALPCIGEPITDPITIGINYLDYVNTPPTASNPDAINVQCIGNVPAPDVEVVTDEADNSGTPPVVTWLSDVSNNNSNPETITRTYRITDDCNNFIDVTQSIIVNDTTNPVTPTLTNVTGECSATATAPTTTDDCVGTITGTTTDPLTYNTQGTFTINWTFDDGNGNSISVPQTVIVDDVTSPIIDNANISNIEIECGVGDTQATLTAWLNSNAGATATDTCSSVTWSNNYGFDDSVKCDNGAISVVFTATDAYGNMSTTSATYLIKDTDAPNITQQALNETVECDGAGNLRDLNTWLSNNGGASAMDTCSTVSWSNNFTTLSDDCGLTGSATVTFTATDACGNKSSTMATFMIVDTTPPAAPNAPENITYQCISDVPVPGNLTAIDICAGNMTVTGVDITDNSNPCDITIARTWTFTDACNNTSIATQTITVKDTIPPILILPANVSAECSDDLSPIAFGNATATDNCDSSPVIDFKDKTTDGACPGNYTITRTWTATDSCGNTTTADQIISTSDTTAPDFVETDLPQDITIECNSVPTAETLTATDNCGTASVTVRDTREDGNCPNNYKILRVWTATDLCGLTRTHTQIITVQDTTPPTFDQTTLPASNLVVECDAVPTAETLTATDICGTATVSVSDIRTNGSCKNNYTIARTWIAKDGCGNETKHTQIIVVRDTKAPKFVQALPRDTTVECDAVPNAETLTATDNCGSANVTVMDVKTIGNCPNNYIIVRTWTATDECGLKATHTQIITVQDTKAPTPASIFDAVLNVSCTDIPEVPALKFEDNCSSNIIVVFNETSTFQENVYVDYQIVRTWTVRDECNNEAVYKQTLNVRLDEVVTQIVAEDRCFDDGIVNLNALLPSTLNTNGTWELLEGNPVATLTGSIFNPTLLELSLDFLPNDGGIDYVFKYTTTNDGCISITEVTMNINANCVVLPCGENDIVISRAVTPNGDLINDSFYISGIDLCGFKAEVKIFNRWGALIFESNEYPQVKLTDTKLQAPAGSWNGTSSKASFGAAGKVPNGTYYYIITFRNENGGSTGLPPFTGPVYLGTN